MRFFTQQPIHDGMMSDKLSIDVVLYYYWLNRNGGTVAYMRPHINFTRELLASSARVRDNIGVFSIKIIGRSQRTSRAYQIVRPILSVGSSVRFLKDSFDRIVFSRSDY